MVLSITGQQAECFAAYYQEWSILRADMKRVTRPNDSGELRYTPEAIDSLIEKFKSFEANPHQEAIIVPSGRQSFLCMDCNNYTQKNVCGCLLQDGRSEEVINCRDLGSFERLGLTGEMKISIEGLLRKKGRAKKILP